MKAMSDHLPDTLQTLVVCRIGAQDYALPLDATLRVVRLPTLTVLPDHRPEVCGLLNLSRRYLPVLDGRRLVGESAHYDLNSQIVIIGAVPESAETPALGLLVDEVYGLAHHPVTTHLLQTDYAGRLFLGVVHLDQRSCPVFDVAELRRIGT